METTELSELADDVASILEENEGHSRQEALALVGTCALIAGGTYVAIRLVRRVVDAHRVRKLNKQAEEQ